MKLESDDITDDEWLYRRVHETRVANLPRVSPSAFEPRVKGTDPDVDGISLFRADCLADAEQVLEVIPAGPKRDANGLVKLRVSEVRELGIQVRSSANGVTPGHVSLVQLNSLAFKNAETRGECRDWMNKLSEICSTEERVVIVPASLRDT